MKRLASSDSLGAFISVCPSSEEKGSSHVYRRGFQSMLDGLDDGDCVEESGQISEKKRRLSVDQVKALERNFEVENKLEPERKVKLAQDLGLQPRQVAVWFQNRRARWKTKQLERDYNVLKANYDSLKLNFEALQEDKEALLAEIRELKAKTQEDNTESNVSAAKEEEILISESVDNRVVTEQSQISMAAAGLGGSETAEPNQDCNNNTAYGSSDSDSSAILNEDNCPNAAISSSGVFQQQQLLISPAPSSLRFNCSSTTSSPSPTSLNCFQFSDSRLGSKNPQKACQQPQYVKMEEHNFFGAEEHCNFFSDEQAPTLHWYCLDQWN